MKLQIIALCILVYPFTQAQVQKENPLPQDLPRYGSQSTFRSPEVKASKLGNGLTVWLVSQPGLPLVSFRVVVLGGLAFDPAEQQGLSDLIAKALTRGTKMRTARQIAEQIQEAGGDFETDSDRDSLTISTTVLSSKAALALNILADVLQDALFPEKEVAIVKQNARDELRSEEAGPTFQANRAIARVLFGSGPYSVIAPSQESLSRITADDLRREFSRRFRPDQAILIVVGDFDVSTMSGNINEALGKWKVPSGSAVASSLEDPPPSAPHTITFATRQNSVQVTLLLAGFTPLRNEPDYEAAVVANAIYGGAFTSRLVLNLREDKGYTYTPGSILVTLRHAAYLSSRADVRNAVTGASLNEMLYELNRMATTTPSEEEIGRAKRYLLGMEAVLMQSRAQLAVELANLWLNGLGPDAIDRYNRKIAATKVSDVESVSKRYFSASRMAIVAVGDETVIRDALDPFGLPIHPAK
jgi:zinc protease